jgi:hypothetical protein
MKARAGGFSEDAFWLLGPAGLDIFQSLKDEGHDLQTAHFPRGGFYVMRKGTNYLLVSCGTVGTGGQGNHKHNDLLSFELYAGDKAFIVDPGTYLYTSNADWRNLFRSTRYHNTIVIDGQEQNRFDPRQIFKMTPDAGVVVHDWLSTPDLDRLDVEHSGYARLERPVSHRRKFEFLKNEPSWKIIDVLAGQGEHTAHWYFHFDAGIELASLGEGTFRTCCDGTNLELRIRAELQQFRFEIEDGWVSRRYGHKLPAKVLHISGTFASKCRTDFTIRPI